MVRFSDKKAGLLTAHAQQSSQPRLAGLLADPDVDAGEARGLAGRLGLPLLGTPPADALILHLRADRLALEDTAPRGPGPVSVDFDAGALRRRVRQATPRREALARAVGLKGGSPLTVVDATGGLGRDAFVLASLGATLYVIERHPVVYELLRDGWRRAMDNEGTARAAGRMTLVHADAAAWLAALDRGADAVYLDPMYPPEAKGGEVKKGIRSLQRLIGPQADAGKLFAAARAAAPRRLVVKRPRRAPPLEPDLPHFSIEGRHTRFDVYQPVQEETE